MLVIAIVMIVVVGPKDLPKMLRTFGKFTTKLSSMAGDFRRQFDEAMKEADLDDVRQSVNDLRSLNPKNEIRKAFSPMEKAAADVRSGMDTIMRPKTSVPTPPASTDPVAAEPVKTGPVTATSNGSTATNAVAQPQSGANNTNTAEPKPVRKSRTVTAKGTSAKARTTTSEKPVAAAAKLKAESGKSSPAKPKASVESGNAASSGATDKIAAKPARSRKPKEGGSNS